MRPNRVTTTAVVFAAAMSLGGLAPAASSAAAATKTYLPVAGVYHLNDINGYTPKGSFTVPKSRKAITHFSFVIRTDFNCPGKVTVSGPLKLHKVKDTQIGGTAWSVGKKFDSPIHVTVHQNGKKHKATLSFDIEHKNGSVHPVKYADGDIKLPECPNIDEVLLGGYKGKP